MIVENVPGDSSGDFLRPTTRPIPATAVHRNTDVNQKQKHKNQQE